MNFCGFRRFNVNPSGAPRQLPLHKGAMSRCDFRLCAAEKTEAKIKVSTPKTAEKRKSRTLLQSLRDSSLPEGAFGLRVFFLCAAKKTRIKFKAQNSKSALFAFCGTSARQRLPSSGRKVSRESVTKGARGSERWHIFLFSHRTRTPNRLPSF